MNYIELEDIFCNDISPYFQCWEILKIKSNIKLNHKLDDYFSNHVNGSLWNQIEDNIEMEYLF